MPGTDNKHMRVSRLEIPAEMEYNNSRIVCITVLYAREPTHSNMALFLVQGTLIVCTRSGKMHHQCAYLIYIRPGCYMYFSLSLTFKMELDSMETRKSPDI